MPRFLALRIEHKLDDLISFCVSAVVLAAAQITQEPSRFFFEFTARFASLVEMSGKQDRFAVDLCSSITVHVKKFKDNSFIEISITVL